MNIFICGDPHGEFDHILAAAEEEKPDAVILLGDLDLQAPLDIVFDRIKAQTQLWWIPGNHDTESEAAYDFLFNSSLADHNLHGRVVDIGGVRIAGLGGVFRSKIWAGGDARYDSQEEYLRTCGKGNLWRGGLPMRHRSSIFPSDISLLKNARADILVTHEAPALHQYGSPVLSRLASDLQVKSAFHGHHHQSLSYSDGVWHGVGLRDIYRLG